MLDSHKAPYRTIRSGLQFVANASASRKKILFGTISDHAGAGGPRYRRAARDALQVADRLRWPEFWVRRKAADRRIERATLRLPDDL